MSPLVDFGAVCQKVREAVEPARVHAVSLHDNKGEVLWLTESSMGPDEHNAVREAFEAFSNANGPPVLDYDLGDSRSAVLFRAVNSRRSLVGAIMIVMDSRGIKQIDKGAARLMNPKLQKALSEFAGMRPEAAPPIAAAPIAAPSRPAAVRAPAPKAPPTRTPQATSAAAAPSTVASAMARAATARAVPASAAPTRAAPQTNISPPVAARAASAGAAPPLDLSLADSVRTARPPVPPAAARAAPATAAPRIPDAAAPDKRQPQAVTPEIDRLHAALRRSPIALHVQRLVPLAKGSQLRRYEVLLRSKSEDAPNSAPHAMLKAAVENGLGSMIDRRVVTELIGWLVHHPDVWQKRAVLFSVNLTSTALQDEHFMKFVELCLMKSSLPKAMIAFEVDVPTAIQLGDKIADVAAALHRLGCPMVLDDFGMRTECFDLLRLPAVRYVKIASEITAKMRSDKVSQAAITAVVQMARVLGMHTVAKRTETAAEQEWLTALGVDFIQSNALSPPVSIESLSTVQKPPPSALTK
ncbi:MAG TPA: EAL domain-containing protein [Steroidobacteraceae bacterium]|nr:EAL domain-containing protein [Steroidobacteraceae bacterium]